MQFDQDPPVFLPVDESGAGITSDTEPIETYKVSWTVYANGASSIQIKSLILVRIDSKT